MKKRRLIQSILIIVTGLATLNVQGKNKTDKVHQLNRDIVLLNLINGLHLTPEQVENIIGYNETAEKIREDCQKQLNKKERATEKILSDVRKILLQNQEIPDKLKKDVYQMKKQHHNLEDEQSEQLLQIEADIKNLLTTNQLIVIDTYKPCTIPPEEGKIGQSVETAAKGITRSLSQIRQMPESRYREIKDFLIDMYIDKIARHMNAMDENTKNQYRLQMENVFKKSRNLSDQKFMIQKNDLAKSLIPNQQRKHHRKKNDFSKVGHFLLNPALVPLLKNN